MSFSLRAYGFYRELGYSGIAESIKDAASGKDWSTEEERVLFLGYLRSGKAVMVTLEVLFDVFSDAPPDPWQNAPIGSGLHILTDGTWVWPDIIAYYIEQYDLVPDAQFVAHARSLGFVIPELREEWTPELTAAAEAALVPY